MYCGEEYYRAFINGDDRAFEKVVELYSDGLIFFINRYVHNLSEAEDIATDTFLYIVIHKNKFDFNYSLKTFLYTIGRSKALTFLRKNKRNKANANIDNYVNIADEQDIEQTVIKGEMKKMLYEAIAQLPEDMQNIVYLFYFENASYQEISVITGKDQKQVDNLLYRAKKMLKVNMLKEV
ncbi:MAG: sigma-70 family RNA polymerase sigma factor [Clostridia bacterium]|nr:sigma-70 family RNA polymerase sigma factor [Clostridia bacterium]